MDIYPVYLFKAILAGDIEDGKPRHLEILKKMWLFVSLFVLRK